MFFINTCYKNLFKCHNFGFQVKQSLNPLPPEMFERGSSEREKSSEPIPVESDEEEDETGASVNGDVEDNLDETTTHIPVAQVSMTSINPPPMADESRSTREASYADPYCPGIHHKFVLQRTLDLFFIILKNRYIRSLKCIAHKKCLCGQYKKTQFPNKVLN